MGKGAVGRVGLLEGDAAQALFADPPEAVPAGPPTCPFHPTFLSRSAPASDLAVIEVGEQCMLFFMGSVHQLEVCKGDNADAESEIHFAMSGAAPLGAADHTVASGEHGPSVAVAQVLEGRGMGNQMPT